MFIRPRSASNRFYDDLNKFENRDQSGCELGCQKNAELD